MPRQRGFRSSTTKHCFINSEMPILWSIATAQKISLICTQVIKTKMVFGFTSSSNIMKNEVQGHFCFLDVFRYNRMDFAIKNKIHILPYLWAPVCQYVTLGCVMISELLMWLFVLHICYLFLQNLISLLEEFPTRNANKQGFILRDKEHC